MKQFDTQRGFSLLEILAALALAALMMTSLTAMVDISLQDTKGQQVAKYQEQFTSAAARYINDNAVTLYASTASATQTINYTQLTSAGYLPNGFALTNAYQQTPCVLVRQHSGAVGSPNSLDALVVTEGGTTIAAKDLGYIGANAGTGGGVIDFGVPAGPSLIAHGSGWQLDNAMLSSFTSASCSGTAANLGHLASAIFYGGPNGINRDVLYRGATTDPTLNTMTTPLGMSNGAIKVVGTACGTALAIAMDVNHNILTCDLSGQWSGGSSWKQPVASYAALGALASPPQDGDVHMTLDNGRAYMYKAGTWIALALDQNDNFTVPNTGSITVAGGNLTVGGNATIGSGAVGSGTLKANNINATLDITAGQDIRIARDLQVTRDISAGNNIKAVQNINGNIVTGVIVIGQSLSPYGATFVGGGSCNNPTVDANGVASVALPFGTLVSDANGYALECRKTATPPAGGTGILLYVDGNLTTPPP